MKALVVFESMFGNTQRIAEAVADGLSIHGPVDLVEVGVAPSTIDDEVDLLVVGGPTHAWSMSRHSTRDDAAKQAAASGDALVSKGDSIREWLETVPKRSTPIPAAAFGTRFKTRFAGSAARRVSKRLRRLGFKVDKPASFIVTGTKGPLVDGEVERARRWGSDLGSVHI